MSDGDFERAFVFASFDAGWTPCKPSMTQYGSRRHSAIKYFGEQMYIVNCWAWGDGSRWASAHSSVEFSLNEFERHKVLVERSSYVEGWHRAMRNEEEWRDGMYAEWVASRNLPAKKTKSPAPSAPQEQKMTTKVENSTIKNTLLAAKDAAVEGAKLAAAQQASALIRDTVRGYMPPSYLVAVSSPLGEAAESFIVPMIIHAAVDLVPNVPNADKVKSAAEYAMTAEAKDRLGALLAQLAPMLRELGSKMGTGA